MMSSSDNDNSSLDNCSYVNGFERSEVFEHLFGRLQTLEKWKELAIRPSSLDACDPEDLDLFQKQQDDVAELQERCNQVRARMNASLPPIQIIKEWDCCLLPKESCIEGAGLGLFYRPPLHSEKKQGVIPKGTTICYYTGRIHNVQSSRDLLSDNGYEYLMMVQGGTLVDPGPCLSIKARYINDPLNETAINCQYIAEDWRSAVVTTRDILPGEELFVAYGGFYWSQQRVPGKRYQP